MTRQKLIGFGLQTVSIGITLIQIGLDLNPFVSYASGMLMGMGLVVVLLAK